MISLTDTQKHFPGKATHGESYPSHLVELINMHKRLLLTTDDIATPLVSVRNYEVRSNIIGVQSPIGIDTHHEE